MWKNFICRVWRISNGTFYVIFMFSSIPFRVIYLGTLYEENLNASKMESKLYIILVRDS